MRPTLLVAALGLVLAGCSSPPPAPAPAKPSPPSAAAPAEPAVAPSSSAPVAQASASAPAGIQRELTIYSGDFDAVSRGASMVGWGFAQEQWTPSAGASIQRGDLPTTTDVTSVLLQAPQGQSITAQRYVGGQDPEALQGQAIGQSVSVWAANQDQPLSGTLVGVENGTWILASEGKTTVVSNPVAWQANVAAGNASRWEWDVSGAGTTPWSLAYGFTGVAWQSDTVLTVATDEAGACRLGWSTDALVANRSGQALQAQSLSLVAGSPAHAKGPPTYYAQRAVAAAAPMAAMPEAQTAGGEQYRYQLTGPAALPNGAIARVPLVRPAGAVACERYFSVGSPPTAIPLPVRPMATPGIVETAAPVRWGLDVVNTTEAGLGMPLPAGRVRVMEGNTWSGEAQIPHTPVGQSLSLDLGTPFDITAERQVTAFTLTPDRQGATETVRVTLKNAKASAATVRVYEAFPRWREWALTASTVPATEQFAQGARFDVSVPASSEAVFEYTVTYRWPGQSPI